MNRRFVIADVGICPSGDAVRDSPKEEQIEIAREWIRRAATRTKTVRKLNSSYALKHDVECWTKAERGTRTYISNGAFIEAMRREGFRVQPVSVGESYNAWFNASIRWPALTRDTE